MILEEGKSREKRERADTGESRVKFYFFREGQEFWNIIIIVFNELY